MKRKTAFVLALAILFGLCLNGCARHKAEKTENGGNSAETEKKPDGDGLFSGGDGTKDNPYLIATAEDLAAVNDRPGAHYRLTADIDLSGTDWTPIGTFSPSNDGNISPDGAFTGTFDGGSFTVRNLKTDRPEGIAAGLFGFLYDAHIYNLTVENASVNGCAMTGAVAGYMYNSRLTAVSLTGNNSVAGHAGETEKVRMIGGMVGGAKNSMIDSCSAKANVFLPDGGRYAAVLCGGMEATSAVNCYAGGSVMTGDGCYGIGGIAGCGLGSEEFVLCAAENLWIAVGENSGLIGSIAGCAGGYENDSYGLKVTRIQRCSASNVNIQTGETFTDINGIVGGGFYPESHDFRGAFPDSPTVFAVEECSVENVTVNDAEISEAVENVNETEENADEPEQTVNEIPEG